jgi:hypothetical protein
LQVKVELHLHLVDELGQQADCVLDACAVDRVVRRKVGELVVEPDCVHLETIIDSLRKHHLHRVGHIQNASAVGARTHREHNDRALVVLLGLKLFERRHEIFPLLWKLDTHRSFNYLESAHCPQTQLVFIYDINSNEHRLAQRRQICIINQ